ncbi:MAG TPA: HAD hydrolase-like protein, partial [Candidatus Paceibacterota bacterium]|nr:HAD hydrolase-like protein [Candidatus Paceibacterota bacterium]
FNETAFVGDEIRDVEAAKKNKLAAVGVTWGVNSREGLAGARPDAIVDTAGELLEYLTAGYRRMSSPRVPIAMQ